MPDARQLVDHCSQHKVFSTLDLKAGFHNIRLTEASADVSGIATQRGLYRWLRMQFGMVRAPAWF